MPELEVKELNVLLSESLGEEVAVLEQRAKYLTPPGEHYGSIMWALDVTIKRLSSDKEENLNLVAKMLPASEMLRIAFDTKVTFKKELDAYTKTIPALIKFQREYKVSEDKILDIFPKCYGGRLSLTKDMVDDDGVIIFENLKVQGYNTGDRFVGFDLEHAKMIVKDLAKFHAVPIAMRILRPNEFQEYVRPCIIPNAGIEVCDEEVVSAFTDSVVEVSKTIPELEPYLEKIFSKVENATNGNDKINLAPLSNPIYASAVHSDYWVNNTMVLEDSQGRPIKNKMVDLQIMQYDSALRDLLFFLFTSVINTVLDKHYDELIKEYYDTFINYLKDFKLDLEPFGWDAFLAELEIAAQLEFFHITFMLKPIFTEKGKVKSLAEFQTSDWARKDLLGPAHRQKLKDTILSLAKRNWI